jgi:hypothetical protein
MSLSEPTVLQNDGIHSLSAAYATALVCPDRRVELLHHQASATVALIETGKICLGQGGFHRFLLFSRWRVEE